MKKIEAFENALENCADRFIEYIKRDGLKCDIETDLNAYVFEANELMNKRFEHIPHENKCLMYVIMQQQFERVLRCANKRFEEY